MEKPEYVLATEEPLLNAQKNLSKAQLEHQKAVAIKIATAQAVNDAWTELETTLEQAIKAIDRWFEEKAVIA